MCKVHRPLNANGICGKCNERQALRECNRCHEILPIFLSFYGRKKTCKECLKLGASESRPQADEGEVPSEPQGQREAYQFSEGLPHP